MLLPKHRNVMGAVSFRVNMYCSMMNINKYSIKINFTILILLLNKCRFEIAET